MLIIIAGAIFVFIVLLFVVGSFLPERYEARVTLQLASPPEKVWAAISDYETHPMTGAQRQSTQKQPEEGGLPVWVEDLGATKVTVRTLSATAPTHMKLNMTDSVVHINVDCEFRIEPANGGSRVTATSQTTVPSGTWRAPLFRVTLKMGGGKKGFRDYWSSVAKTLGETQFEKYVHEF